MKKIILLCTVWCFLTLYSCADFEPTGPEEYELLDGPIEGLDFAQTRQHLSGDNAFNGEVFTAESGLGPLFVASSCVSCHAGDGKGHPSTTLTRFGVNDSLGKNEFDHGPQLQNRALPGYTPETIPAGAPRAKFVAPIGTGLGYLEFVTESDIISMAASNTTNVDGVRGKPNWISIPSYVAPIPNSIQNGSRYIGRFGKKAAIYNLLHQTVFAYNQDMGIASSFDPSDVYSLLDIDPEVSDNTVRDVVFYLQTLKAPLPRNQNNSDVVAGKEIFNTIGCADCHKPSLKTGFSKIQPLSNQEFHPYTDLLVHDMGPRLDDGYTEGSALPGEWRTAPLWGLGLAKNSQGGSYFLLHDGRAKSIDEAILFHGGEAEISKERYRNSNESTKKQIIKFLESL